MITINSHLSLQPIKIEDQPKLLELMQEVYPAAYGHFWKDDCSWYLNHIYSLESLKKDLATPQSHYHFILYKNETVGIFKYVYNQVYTPLSPLAGLKLHRLYLHPSVQGKGVGRDIMQYGEQLARRLDYKIIWLDAMHTHTQAQLFYKKAGYIKTEFQLLPFDLLKDEHRKMWYMHKMLPSPK